MKTYKTVVLCGSVINDGQYTQLFKLSAAVLGQSQRYLSAVFKAVRSCSWTVTKVLISFLSCLQLFLDSHKGTNQLFKLSAAVLGQSQRYSSAV